MTEPGLRERKKQRTRATISSAATGLFEERGFDAVTLADIAAATEVSVNTILNYFGSKEELFFDARAEVEDAPSRVARERLPGESLLAALRRDRLRGDPLFLVRVELRTWLRTIEESTALRATLRAMMDRRDDLLAETLTAETGDQATARLVASTLGGVHRAVAVEHRRRFRDGQQPRTIRAAVVELAERGYALLEPGIGNYPATGAQGGRARASFTPVPPLMASNEPQSVGDSAQDS